MSRVDEDKIGLALKADISFPRTKTRMRLHFPTIVIKNSSKLDRYISLRISHFVEQDWLTSG